MGLVSSEDTPSDGGNKDTMSPASYPETITFANTSFYLDKGTLKGYLPYPLINGSVPEGCREALFLKSSEANSDIRHTEFNISTSDGGSIGYYKDQDFFTGVEANLPIPNSSISTKGNFELSYQMECQNLRKGIEANYIQTGASSWKKVNVELVTW